MQLANTVIGALGDLLVLVTLVVAMRTLKSANGARQDARAAEDKAERARNEFAVQQRSWQRETELVRRRQRVQEAGEIIEDLFWAVQEDAPPGRWMYYRNRLGQVLVGLTGAVPDCAAILNAATARAALGPARLGRDEIQKELDRIDGELRKLHNPAISAAPGAKF